MYKGERKNVLSSVQFLYEVLIIKVLPWEYVQIYYSLPFTLLKWYVPYVKYEQGEGVILNRSLYKHHYPFVKLNEATTFIPQKLVNVKVGK